MAKNDRPATDYVIRSQAIRLAEIAKKLTKDEAKNLVARQVTADLRDLATQIENEAK